MDDEGGTSTWIKVTIAAAVLAIAVGATLALLQSGEDGDGAEDAPVAADNGIWAEGDTWTVTVAQDGSLINAEGEGATQEVPYTFEVIEAPAEREGLADGTWIVRIDQDGQQGPFADGWRLGYTETAESMELAWVAIGEGEPSPRENAIVLGAGFPLTAVYREPPVDEQLTAEQLNTEADLLLPPELDVPEPTPGGIPEGQLENAPEGVPTPPDPGADGPADG